MNIIVCVKHVPETAEADLRIDNTGSRIETGELIFDINEWDNYALEEAVLLKETLGGSVTAITVASEEADDMLRYCLARGSDKAIRLTDAAVERSDSYAVAKILHEVIKEVPFDLILTGAQASDDGCAQVGPVLAQLLGIPHATMVKRVEPGRELVQVYRGLEEGYEEVVELTMPALLTIETGIHEPRYASLRNVVRAREKTIQTLSLRDGGLGEDDVGETGSWITVKKMFIPPAQKEVEILRGNPDEVAVRLIEILKDKGVV